MRAGASPASAAVRRTILLIEDNPADARLAVEAFGACAVPCRVEHLTDGAQALALLRERLQRGEPLPDLVLLDLNLPGLDGRELLAALKGAPGLRRIPVIVLTTSRAEADVLACYELHANSFVAKPMDLDSFERVAEAISRFWLETAELP